MENNLNKLKTNILGIDVYLAGLPDYPRNFTRDSIIAAIIMKDPNMLKNQLMLCALLQGKKFNSFTAEEPGKIHHEFPEVIWNKLSTVYNACDTTALFLIGHKYYIDWTNDRSLAEKQQKNIENAVNYILNHLKNYFFIDSPKFCNAESFALPITYWKDAWIPNRRNFEPEYPVVYTLAHIQNMQGLRSAAFLLNKNNLNKIANKMRKNLKNLYDKKLGGFYIGLDNKGPIQGIGSDSLHSLFYLNKQDITLKKIKKIIWISKILETSAGYRTQDERLDNQNKKDFYVDNICPFEQAIINIAAKKFNLNRVRDISNNVNRYLNTAPELLILKNKTIKNKGSDPQLWTIAAKEYFNSMSFDKNN